MRISGGIKKVWIEPTIGRFIVDDDYKEFLTKTNGAKFKYIREQLNIIYPGRFTRQMVADHSGLSKQGLINIEEENQKKNIIQSGSITLLCNAYDLDERLITDSKYQNSRTGFLLAVWEDKDKFFTNYQEQFLFRHDLDPKSGFVGVMNEDTEDDSDGSQEIQTDGYDVIYNADGSYSLDRVTIDVSLKLYQTSTELITEGNFLKVQAVLSVQDADHIKNLVLKEIKLLEDRHRSYINLKNDYDNFKLLTEAEVAIGLIADPEKKEDAIKAIYDVRRKLRNKKETNQT